MQLNFFALEDDIALILDYLLNEEDFSFFEGYSETDKPIRQFTSVDQWRDARMSKGRCLLLRGRDKSFTNNPVFKEIIHAPEIGGSRTCLEGAAIVQIAEGRFLENGALYPANIGHWNEAGARQRSIWTEAQLNEVDWTQLRKISGRMQRYIKNKLARAKLRSFPILPAAYEAFIRGEFNLWNFGEIVTPSSCLIEAKP